MTNEFKATRINPAAFTLPVGILEQDYEIIDEQENHIVMTARLPIDVIRDNNTTLTALSEIATGTPRPLAEPEGDGATFTLPAAVLRQGTVVIDEQENHVVLTVRLPLDMIRKNHALLRAFSEIARERSPAEPENDLDDAE